MLFQNVLYIFWSLKLGCIKNSFETQRNVLLIFPVFRELHARAGARFSQGDMSELVLQDRLHTGTHSPILCGGCHHEMLQLSQPRVGRRCGNSKYMAALKFVSVILKDYYC